MKEAVDDVLVLRGHDPRAFRRVMTISFAFHLGLLGLLALPHGWLFRERVKPKIMVISLGGGSPGPRSTGVAPIAARPVEQVAPPPKRPEPIRPAAPKPKPMIVPAKTPPKPEPVKPSDTAFSTPIPKPPTTGREVTQGTSLADTGAKGPGTGLSFGGGAGNATLDVQNFCCPAYLSRVLAIIESHWSQNQPQKGETTVKFTIQHDGSIALDKMAVEKSGGGFLDRQSLAALMSSSPTLPPLPQEFTGQSLTIHLRFPYGIR